MLRVYTLQLVRFYLQNSLSRFPKATLKFMEICPWYSEHKFYFVLAMNTKSDRPLKKNYWIAARLYCNFIVAVRVITD